MNLKETWSEEDKRKALVAGGLVGLLLLLLLARKAGETFYECPYCGLLFATEEELLHHIQQEHPQEPPPPTTLSGTVIDNSTSQLLSGVKVSLDGAAAYTDTSGAYAFYGLTPDTVYTISVEKEYYNPFCQEITIQPGDNLLHMKMDPVLIQSVTFGIRTRAGRDDLPTPSGSYLSRPCMQITGYIPYLVGPGYIGNSTNYTDHRVGLSKNPITNKAWKETDLLTYRFGVWLWASVAVSGNTRCTQMWLEALYSDGSVKILRPYSGGSWEKVADVIPDEDASYISMTTSGGPIPGSGRYTTWLVK